MTQCYYVYLTGKVVSVALSPLKSCTSNHTTHKITCKLLSSKYCSLWQRDSCCQLPSTLSSTQSCTYTHNLCLTFPEYLPNVRCYNRIHMDGTLKQCNEHVWDDVANFLANVTSHSSTATPSCQQLKVSNSKYAIHQDSGQFRCEQANTMYK